MPFYDLNVVYSSNHIELGNTLAFLKELGYGAAALSIPVTGKLSNQPELVPTEKITIPASLRILTRTTITISDTSQNHRLNSLTLLYNIVALRPTNDKALQLCCSSLECDIISLDFSQRLLYPLKFKTVASALQRGIRFEICYSPGIVGGHDARRNLIAGAASLIRATRGRGIILSSEAKSALGARAPWDVINLAQVWGLSQDRAKESICDESGKVVRLAEMKRTSFRGVVDIVEDGTVQNVDIVKKPASPADSSATTSKSVTPMVSSPMVEPLKKVTVLPHEMKRKASSTPLREAESANKPLSKREMKRQAKRARLEKAAGTNEDHENESVEKNKTKPVVKHNSLSKPRVKG